MPLLSPVETEPSRIISGPPLTTGSRIVSKNRKLWFQRGKMVVVAGWISSDVGNNIYTLLYIKCIINKEHSTGNYIQYSIMTYVEKESEKE